MAKEKNKETLNLIEEFLKGDKRAYEELYLRYKNSIRGYIAGRCFWIGQNVKGIAEKDVDPRIKDMEQNTWKEMLQKISTYDSSKASFYTFICYWANIIIKRYSFRAVIEMPISALKDQDGEETDEEFLGRIGGQTQIFPSDECLDKYNEFLEITFSQCGPPHQLITFGFNKLIDWGPQDIVKELSLVLLRELTERLISDFEGESKLPAYIVRNCFKPLKDKMDKKLKEVLEDEVSKNTYINLIENKTGKTVLKNYYGKDPEHNISDWSDKVLKRIRRLTKSSAAPRETAS